MLGILGLGAIFVQLNEIMDYLSDFLFGIFIVINIMDNWIEIRFLIENLFFGTRVVYLQSHFPREKDLVRESVRHSTVACGFFYFTLFVYLSS